MSKAHRQQLHSRAEQATRDLLWAVNSPSLISDPRSVDVNPIDCSSIDGEQLVRFLGEPPVRLVGKYFEQLVHFYLREIRRYEILDHGLQIQDACRTIGELDFVFRDATGQLQHWETAVKFFLHLPDVHQSGSHLVGPNPADNFESKTTRLFEHQLPMSRHVYSDIAIRRAFVRGRIFYHPHTPPDNATGLPTQLASNHLRGIWIRASELQSLRELFPNSTIRCRIQKKPFWLANDIWEGDVNEGIPVSEMTTQITQHFATSDRPRLVSLCEPEHGVFREVNRVFVVADTWPDGEP